MRHNTIDNKQGASADKSPCIDEPDYFEHKRPSRKGGSNEQDLEKLQSEIMTTQMRLNSLNTQAQQE